jgi:hypothetical protein
MSYEYGPLFHVSGGFSDDDKPRHARARWFAESPEVVMVRRPRHPYGPRPMARLFLCDDDSHYRALLRIMFENSGHEVVGEGCDGQDCLDQRGRRTPR